MQELSVEWFIYFSAKKRIGISSLSSLQVIGSCWYLLSVERLEECWKDVCDLQQPNCRYFYFDCQTMSDADRKSWFASSNITKLCSPNSKFYNFGIYADALTYGVEKSSFLYKYSYCLWWGLRNLRYVPRVVHDKWSSVILCFTYLELIEAQPNTV